MVPLPQPSRFVVVVVRIIIRTRTFVVGSYQKCLSCVGTPVQASCSLGTGQYMVLYQGYFLSRARKIIGIKGGGGTNGSRFCSGTGRKSVVATLLPKPYGPSASVQDCFSGAIVQVVGLIVRVSWRRRSIVSCVMVNTLIGTKVPVEK
jgi:hypothetical protein